MINIRLSLNNGKYPAGRKKKSFYNNNKTYLPSRTTTLGYIRDGIWILFWQAFLIWYNINNDISVRNWIFCHPFYFCFFSFAYIAHKMCKILSMSVHWNSFKFEIEGWERKMSKCFFTYIHIDLFRSHPLKYDYIN